MDNIIFNEISRMNSDGTYCNSITRWVIKENGEKSFERKYNGINTQEPIYPIG